MITIKEGEGGQGIIIYNDEGEVIRDASEHFIVRRREDYRAKEKEIAMMGTTISFIFKHAQYYAETNEN